MGINLLKYVGTQPFFQFIGALYVNSERFHILIHTCLSKTDDSMHNVNNVSSQKETSFFFTFFYILYAMKLKFFHTNTCTDCQNPEKINK